MKLTALFKIKLPFELLVERMMSQKDWEELAPSEKASKYFSKSYKVVLDEFEIKCQFFAPTQYQRNKSHNAVMTYVSRLELYITREEQTNAPELKVNADGQPDDSDLHTYFQERFEVYKNTALTILNRIISYFKFELKNPLLRKLEKEEVEITNDLCQWINESGEVIYDFYMTYIMMDIRPWPNEINSLGYQTLSPQKDLTFEDFLLNPRTPELYEELLSDAQAAAVEGNLRRAVLELAIACETVIYQGFFGNSTPASEAFDLLVVEQYVQVPPKDLIHKVAKRAFGESFKDKYLEHWNNIENLFQCRNKVAHRGQLKYVAKEKTYDVDRKLFAEWWHSVDILITWLNEQIAKSSS